MKTGKSLIELATELQRREEAKRDFKAPAHALTVDLRPVETVESEKQETKAPPTVTMKIDGIDDAFTVSPIAHGQIAEKTGIPKKYYDRMMVEEPELYRQSVNTWFRHNGASKNQTLVRTLDGRVRGFLAGNFRMIDNFDLADGLLPVATELNATLESADVTESKLYMKFVCHEQQYQVAKVGDIVSAGVSITNSEIGMGAAEISPFIYVLKCTNGMKINEATIRQVHIGKREGWEDFARQYFRSETMELDIKAFIAKMQDALRGIFTAVNFQSIVDRMGAAVEDKIEADSVKVVEVVSERFALNREENNSVLKHLLGGGDLSRYGLMQAITRTAQDLTSYDRASDFEELGGKVLELPRQDWKTINVQAAQLVQ